MSEFRTGGRSYSEHEYTGDGALSFSLWHACGNAVELTTHSLFMVCCIACAGYNYCNASRIVGQQTSDFFVTEQLPILDTISHRE